MNSPLARSLTLWACLSATTASFAADAAEALSPAPSERALPSTPIPDRYIVQVAAGTDSRLVAAAHGLAPNFVYQHALQGFAGIIPAASLAALRADPRVLHVIPDRKVAAIGKPAGAGGGSAAQVTPAGIKRIGAPPGTLARDGTGVGVAVVDTGVDFNHLDLQPLGTASFSAFGSSAQDNNGHGTHVAGTIAARNNAIDVVGVAPAATIYAVKVLDASGSGSDSYVIAGLDWIAANAATVAPAIRVVNMSLGRAGTADDNPALAAAVAAVSEKNIAVVVAAGNDASLEISQQVPAAYSTVLAIASTTAQNGSNQYRFYNGFIAADTASYFTSDGLGVTVSAPGEDREDIAKNGFIKSVGILSTKLGGGTTRMSGTSMAAPHAAGVAALVYQANPPPTVEELRTRLIASADRAEEAPLNSPTSSYTFDGVREGILNAPGALASP